MDAICFSFISSEMSSLVYEGPLFGSLIFQTHFGLLTGFWLKWLIKFGTQHSIKMTLNKHLDGTVESKMSNFVEYHNYFAFIVFQMNLEGPIEIMEFY